MKLSPNQLPLEMRVINRLGKLLRSLGANPPSLAPEALLAKAVREAGLDDFGDEAYREALERLTDSLEHEAELTTLGRMIAADTIKNDLVKRLEMVDYRKAHPELDSEEVRRPLFILGLPRTGTTLLYNLLAQDPRHRVPLSWEVVYPCPPPEPDNYASDPRIAKAVKRFSGTDKIVPNLQSIHPVGALLPEECSTITALEFQSRNYSYCYDIPSYYDWYMNQCQVPVYQAQRRFLQHLQSRFKKERWLLKAPQHLPFLRDLFTAYPDAEIIQTHRDPDNVIPSQASLVYHMRCATSDKVDPAYVGQEKLDRWSWALDRALEARDALPDKQGQIQDLKFDDLMRDPLGEVARIYEVFGWSLSQEAESRMRSFLAANPRGKHGEHRYTLEMFGVTAEAVQQRFAAYRERFVLS